MAGSQPAATRPATATSPVVLQASKPESTDRRAQPDSRSWAPSRARMMSRRGSALGDRQQARHPGTTPRPQSGGTDRTARHIAR